MSTEDKGSLTRRMYESTHSDSGSHTEEQHLNAYELDQRTVTERLMEHTTSQPKYVGSLTDLMTIDEINSDMLSESSSSHTSVAIDDLNEPTYYDDENFFLNIQNIPNIDDLSVGESSDRGTIFVETQNINEDAKGYFLHPLTGSVISSTSTRSSSSSILDAESSRQSSYPSVVQKMHDLSIDLPYLSSSVEVTTAAPATKDEEDILTELYAQLFKPVDTTREEKKSIEERIRLEKLQRNVEFLLHELIDRIVVTAEQRAKDPKRILSKSLDKVALTDKLVEKLAELDISIKRHAFLNRKAIEYFRRKKNFSAIEEERRKVSLADFRKYNAIVRRLDRLLCRRKEIKEVTETAIKNLMEKVAAVEEQATTEEHNFENAVWEIFGENITDPCRNFIEAKLERVRELRQAITKERCALIEKQHTMARLAKYLSELENLGNGLLMSDYENMQRQTISLSKKLEERNAEFENYSMRCKTNVHATTHLKEKLALMHEHSQAQDNDLAYLVYERQMYREEMRYLKLKRIKLQKDIRDYSFQCGLLDKPALLLDYDVTVARLSTSRANITKLKSKLSDLNIKIRIHEERLSDLSKI